MSGTGSPLSFTEFGRQWLVALDFTDRKFADLDKQIEEKARPFEATVKTWMRVPRLRRVNAFRLLAEIGADMKQFPTAAHRASWAAVCPGNRESAGKDWREGSGCCA